MWHLDFLGPIELWQIIRKTLKWTFSHNFFWIHLLGSIDFEISIISRILCILMFLIIAFKKCFKNLAYILTYLFKYVLPTYLPNYLPFPYICPTCLSTIYLPLSYLPTIYQSYLFIYLPTYRLPCFFPWTFLSITQIWNMLYEFFS
jgi:hypothetical protein